MRRPKLPQLILSGDDDHPQRLNLPIVRHLTYDEIHATQLGFVGLPMGAAYAAGHTEISLWFTVGVMAIAFGVKKLDDAQDDTVAEAGVIAREPWYFVGSYLLSALSGAWLHEAVFVPTPPLGAAGYFALAAVALFTFTIAVVELD